MFAYHSQLKATHPFSSEWWSWPLDIRPVWLYTGSALPPGQVSTIATFGNPVIWWAGIPAVVIAAIIAARKRDRGMALVFTGLACQYLPWAIIPRLAFIYHFFSVVPFIVLAQVYVIKNAMEKWSTARYVVYTYLCLAGALFIMFYPLLSGHEVSEPYIAKLRWLRAGRSRLETTADTYAGGTMSETTRFSVIVPVYNEEKVLPEMYQRLHAVMERLQQTYEIIFVNDGSSDQTFSILNQLCEQDHTVRVIEFAKNFGHQTAITAGMDYSRGEAVIVIDADLQDPPEVIPRMITRWEEGYDVVYGKRGERKGETIFKRLSASLLYRLMRKMTDVDIPVDTGDFRLIDARYAMR